MYECDDVFTHSTHERISRLAHEPGPPLDCHTAASLGDGELVLQTARERPGQLDRPNRAGWTPLMYACYYGHAAVVHSLLACGADTAAAEPRGRTPLALTACRGHDDVLLTLLGRGADIECRDARDWTPLHLATDAGHRATVELLLAEGANANALDRQRGYTPLLLAAAAGHELIVFALIRHGANVQLRLPSGASARELAETGGHERVSQLLAEYDASEPPTPTARPADGAAFAALRRDAPPAGAADSGRTAAASDQQQQQQQPADLAALLATVGLQKYQPVLERQEVDLQVFLVMTDDDLKEAGITLLGPRRKMTSAIARWHRNAPLTPGPERAYADRVARAGEASERRLRELEQRRQSCDWTVSQERQLRALTEGLLVEERRRLCRLQEGCADQLRLAAALAAGLARLGAAPPTGPLPEPAALCRSLEEPTAGRQQLLDGCARLALLQHQLTEQLRDTLSGISGRMERATSTG
ncbi:Ankyrin repeat and SAM domain-containing protein 3 [Amphibalanus amphitrite]|uniref:NAD(+) ADP-ribosyltransferase n=1 Tax=Amphibalanus amphitrite TaxID=1232801 RepID=A0A6A4VDG7_AMPAM|nr:Ankyrin repeat and SAM domain-containing protein 3 [Amphibalanus amphitrite]